MAAAICGGPKRQALFSYGSLTRERVIGVAPQAPSVCVIVWGEKEILAGDVCQKFPAESIIVLPAGASYNIVNIPDERQGRFERLALSVNTLPSTICPMGPENRDDAYDFGFGIPLTQQIVDCIIHVSGDVDLMDQSDQVLELRLAELLVFLRASPTARPLYASDIISRIRWILHSDPSHDWTLTEIADRLSLGASTLRRRLAKHGTSFRTLLLGIRMERARDVLATKGDCQTAALEAGYSSRSHFSKSYREACGVLPKDDRASRTS